MARASADRNLLFGILALQMDFITRDALIDAMAAWALSKDRPIEDILVERGAIDLAARDALRPMVAYRVAQQDGDVARCLAGLSSVESIRERLAQIPDTEIQASLARISAAPASRTAPALESIEPHIPSGDSVFETRIPFDGESAPEDKKTRSTGPRFRRLKLHARGGLGEVFIAEDGELNRKVALKEIQEHHADNLGSRSRFLVEAEITGGLEHPGIVPVYGLGQYEDGRPFYAMRFIRGDSLADAIKSFHADPTFKTDPGARTLALQKLLRRFLDVCNAIAYAHSRGILHRDLKPDNVMVGKYGETLVVDWGLAKPLGAPETPTDEESPLLPLSGSGIATIGVIGTPAYMPPEQAEGKIDELGPASDVYSLGATLYHLLTNQSPFQASMIREILDRVKRGDFPPPRSIAPEISKSLEAICLKAMATRSADRYPTPLALAADIEHWLADEPVTALKETSTQRLARWTRRHRSAALAGAAAIAVVAVTASVAFVVVNKALSDKTKALADKTKALAAETAANVKTRAAFESARTTIDDFVTIVREDVRLRDDKALRPVREALIEKALAFAVDFIAKYRDEPLLAADVASAYYDAGWLHDEIGRKDDAVRAYEASLAIRRRLVLDRPEDAALRQSLAATLSNLGVLQSETGRAGDAERSHERACELSETLVKRNPESAAFAEDLAKTFTNLGLLQRATGRAGDAERSHERARELREALVKRNSDSAAFAEGLAATFTNLGNLHWATGRAGSAERSYERARELRELLVKRNPDSASPTEGLAKTLTNLGVLQSETGRAVDAERSYERARELREPLVERNPDSTEFANGLAKTLNNLGVLQSETGRAVEAERSYERARELGETLVKRNPDSAVFAEGLAMTLVNLGVLQSEIGRAIDAERSYERACLLFDAMVKRNPESAAFAESLAATLTNLGNLQRLAGRAGDALRNCRHASKIREGLLKRNPEIVQIRSGLARTYALLGLIHVGESQRDEAIAAFQAAIGHEKEALAKVPDNPGYRRVLVFIYGELAKAHRKFGQAKDVGEAADVNRERRKLSRGKPAELYDVARDISLWLPLVMADRAKYADEAIDTLREAVRAGWSDFRHTANDSDLAPLRDRADFRALLVEMMDRAFPADPFRPATRP